MYIQNVGSLASSSCSEEVLSFRAVRMSVHFHACFARGSLKLIRRDIVGELVSTYEWKHNAY